MKKLILVGVWRGNNLPSIIKALDQLGYASTTIRIYKHKLIIKNLLFRETIVIGEQIFLPEAAEKTEDEES